MKNEPKEIYLFCYDEKETDPSYLPVDDDFETLDSEFVNWGETKQDGCVEIKYVHHTIADDLLLALRMILPMAKGWAHLHDVGANKELVEKADALIAQLNKD